MTFDWSQVSCLLLLRERAFGAPSFPLSTAVRRRFSMHGALLHAVEVLLLWYGQDRSQNLVILPIRQPFHRREKKKKNVREEEELTVAKKNLVVFTAIPHRNHYFCCELASCRFLLRSRAEWSHKTNSYEVKLLSLIIFPVHTSSLVAPTYTHLYLQKTKKKPTTPFKTIILSF